MTWACKDCEEEFPETEQPWLGRDEIKRCQICDMYNSGCSHAAIARVAERQMYGSDTMDHLDREAEVQVHNWGLNE